MKVVHADRASPRFQDGTALPDIIADTRVSRLFFDYWSKPYAQAMRHPIQTISLHHFRTGLRSGPRKLLPAVEHVRRIHYRKLLGRSTCSHIPERSRFA